MCVLSPESQLKAMIGEFVVTIAHLESQKGHLAEEKTQLQQVIEQLTAEIAALTPVPKETDA